MSLRRPKLSNMKGSSAPRRRRRRRRDNVENGTDGKGTDNKVRYMHLHFG